jgi:unsaturated chondroitin disaccharide hydrolase
MLSTFSFPALGSQPWALGLFPMIHIDPTLTPAALLPAIREMWTLSAQKIDSLDKSWKAGDGAPVFTIDGRYTARRWTEWTQGFQFGSPLLQFDATDDERFLEIGRRHTRQRMASHVSHVGVHDHGFNNISTYGALRRLMKEGRIPHNDAELGWYDLALQVSGAVQASRWSTTSDGDGYIYSFNGPHSLFCDTIRSLRSLAAAHLLKHRLMGENDQPISLLGRLIEHARSTARYNVFYGEGRDHYDLRGRVAHESVFNCNDGRYRCPSSQQGYSPFSTWTRGLAWIMLGYAEELEYLETVSDAELEEFGGRANVNEMMLKAARASCDFYIEQTPTDGIPYWDTGAPGLARMGDYLDRTSEPFNDHEPVDSSAAAIACQGLIRLGAYLQKQSETDAARYIAAGLTTLRTLLSDGYLSPSGAHQGLLLHAVYHRPRGWDHIPPGRKNPCGESCQWGDYHLREAALYVQRKALSQPDYRFFA